MNFPFHEATNYIASCNIAKNWCGGMAHYAALYKNPLFYWCHVEFSSRCQVQNWKAWPDISGSAIIRLCCWVVCITCHYKLCMCVYYDCIYDYVLPNNRVSLLKRRDQISNIQYSSFPILSHWFICIEKCWNVLFHRAAVILTAESITS